jgi:hypothetical protein
MAQMPSNPEAPIPDKAHLAELYKEICQNIRVTDEISFKLLGIVPISAGIGSSTLTVLEKSSLLTNSYSGFIVLVLSIFGALITFGLFQWELRNIQRCKWLIAHDISNPQFKGIASEEDLEALELSGIHLAPIRKRPWGKTQAEKLIYWTAIGTWFVPMLVGLHKVVQSRA